MKCPTCGSEEIRRSRKRSLFSMVQRWRGLRRFRCRECRKIFYSEISPAERNQLKRVRALRASRGAEPKPRSPRPRRRAVELTLFLCLVVIFYAALKYLARVP